MYQKHDRSAPPSLFVFIFGFFIAKILPLCKKILDTSLRKTLKMMCPTFLLNVVGAIHESPAGEHCSPLRIYG